MRTANALEAGRPSPSFRCSFAAAVAAAAATLPAVAHATGERVGRRYFITYTLVNGQTFAFEPSELRRGMNANEAVRLFVAEANAMTAFLVALVPSQPVAQPAEDPIDKTSYLIPLSTDVHSLLGLDEEEKAACRVIQTDPGRYAVAELVPRDEWHHLEPGAQILYTALQHTSDTNEASLTTYPAKLLVYDERRALLYANYTAEEEAASIECLEGPAAYEVWLVWRYIDWATK